MNPPDLVIGADLLFDGTRLSTGPIDIVLRAGQIERLERPGLVGGRRLDARGALVMPGLVNAHAHLVRGGAFDPLERPSIPQIVRNLQGSLAAGVTAAGDMGCAAPLIRALRAHTARHPLGGPSLVASGPVLTAPEGYPLDWMPPMLRRMGVVLTCGDEAEARRAVLRVAEAGMDHVKLAIMHQSYAERPLRAISEPAARAVVEEAHRLGLRVLAHAHSLADYDVALAAGVDALMHSCFEPLDADLVARVRDAGIPVCPTLWIFESVCLGSELRFDRERRFTTHVGAPIRRSWRRFAEAYAASGDVLPPGIAGGLPKARAREAVRVAAANLRLLDDAGVSIAFGNDASFGFSLVARPADELAAMQRAGMSALACLRAATAGAARLLGLTDRGAIAPGKRADLIVVDAAAARDVATIERVHAVVAGGHLAEARWVNAAHTATAAARGLAATLAAAIGFTR